MQTFERIGRV